ncbi:hypothetical protein HPB50_020746 [Hyalomma asiaticum]|uniref:Uncharacterized protein n=1 Tax=Hyalomma asiaticum TaxID=266040 RepID=A0ACB7RMG1_HYAAI|nr:hypothetical protein HPB50_020746 [Hyalomma asiaticum]
MQCSQGKRVGPSPALSVFASSRWVGDTPRLGGLVDTLRSIDPARQKTLARVMDVLGMNAMKSCGDPFGFQNPNSLQTKFFLHDFLSVDGPLIWREKFADKSGAKIFLCRRRQCRRHLKLALRG